MRFSSKGPCHTFWSFALILRFEPLATAPTGARAGHLHTRFGVVETPAFMPVGTHAHVRHLSLPEVEATGARILLANTWHLLLRPGPEVFDRFGGIHRFMGWGHGVLTDSGGFQIFSLGESCEVTEEGARFRSPFDQHPVLLTPESSIATQQSIGSDIMMALDVCPPSTWGEAATRAAMERTHRWAARSLEARARRSTGQALFGIVQGGVFPHLRDESVKAITALPFDGFAIGGLAVGESRELLDTTTAHTVKQLPADRPRYLMGVGTPRDLVAAVSVGVDLFDCILPTKMAQQGYAYTFQGQLRITRQEFRLSDEKLDPTCECPVCTRHPRGYLQHLSNGGHALASRLLGIHNLHHYAQLMRRLRTAILQGRLAEESRALLDGLEPRGAPQAVEAGRREAGFELVTLKGGARAVRHLGNGEIMHPGVGPWEEANGLYVGQTGLTEKLQVEHAAPLRVLDLGLGAAANAVAALTAARALGAARRRPLELVSIEHDLGALKLALQDAEGFPFLTPWRPAIEALLRDGHWKDGDLSWSLLLGDAHQKLGEVAAPVHVVFHDPFSPEQNPELWTPAWFRRVHALAGPDGMTLSTYSTSTPVRVSMLLGGFHVGAGVPSGARAETTAAATSSALLARPLGGRWLKRWERSSARAPIGGTFDGTVERAVRGHPQFAG
ncbi:MAG: tRNA guanosine(34) transglycosylase Tgt [Myxococcaceae bacterium]|nr:tRNA guanosine(34) transglycosylase Tgt [Myxococcaceae bacterium]